MNFKGFIDVLPIALGGWAGVFAVILVVWFSIVAMLKCFKVKK
ncbi:MAG: hypothetical protein ACOXZM_01260 [Eubacteriales bacterium]|jgi:hypothetical protein